MTIDLNEAEAINDGIKKIVGECNTTFETVNRIKTIMSSVTNPDAKDQYGFPLTEPDKESLFIRAKALCKDAGWTSFLKK